MESYDQKFYDKKLRPSGDDDDDDDDDYYYYYYRYYYCYYYYYCCHFLRNFQTLTPKEAISYRTSPA